MAWTFRPDHIHGGRRTFVRSGCFAQAHEGLLKTRRYRDRFDPYHGYLKNLVLSLINGWDSHHTALWHHGHIKFWSIRSLRKLMEQEGFQFVSFRGIERFAYVWKSMMLEFRLVARS